MRFSLRHARAYAVVAALGGLFTLRCGGEDAVPGAASGGNGDDASVGGGGGDAGSDAYVTPDTGTPIDAGDPGPADLTFEVHADQNVHRISPLVYGVNDPAQAANARASIVRVGGNRMTAYNWENNASNGGSDYLFENDDYVCSTIKCLPNNDAPGAFLKAIIDAASAAGAATLVTVPMVDYVSADKGPNGDVRNSGAGYLASRFKQNKAAKGAPFANPPAKDDGVVYQDEMVAWIKATAPSADVRYLLDNEPDLWSATHAPIHAQPVTYAELKTRSIQYATAIKAVVPNAQVWGPASYGWAGYVNLQGATDAAANGDFLSYFLAQMKAAEATAGKRLLDGLDLHWYPEAQGDGKRIVDGLTTPGSVVAREQAPRSLWDPTYTETSWIAQTSTHGPIKLIPLIKAKIAQSYPGTLLSFSEWNYGAGSHISGAVASADVLGIYGREGVDMAMLWPSKDESFTYAAFRAYRGYDGAKAFGDTSVAATTTDVPSSSVYASVDAANVARMVLVVVNKATTDKVAGIRIHHSTAYGKANVYTLTAAGGPKLVPGAALTAVGTNAFRYTMPAQSVTVIEPAM